MQLPPEVPLLAQLPPDWPAPEALGFGQYLGPYLVECQHRAEGGWGAPCLTPRAASPLPVASGATQYGLSVFEGLKAYRDASDGIHLFRAPEHAQRLQRSAERLHLPVPPQALILQLCRLAVQVHADYVPPHGRGSLYLRPTLFAEEECLGLRPAMRHRLSIVVTPCSDPLPKSVRLWAEPELIRAAPGGLGAAKTGANYAAGIGGLLRAKERGYDDVAWLDAATHTQLGEAGTMNLFVQIGDEVFTPPLDGTILAGITRDCVMTLLAERGIACHERVLTLAALTQAGTEGTLGSAFGTGTAARIARITAIGDGQREIHFRETGLIESLHAALKRAQETPGDGGRAWCDTVEPMGA
ncbi:aminotransferase class IV [Sinimarinibacterium flocculans]|uniref:aminotransferase class IV n=1 Tax=Sinimarinibacterium flocculans TaxID=985250 RepID=UPI003511C678